MKKAFEEMLGELIEQSIEVDFKLGFEQNGIENDLVVQLMIVEQLARIVASLESIGESLETLK